MTKNKEIEQKFNASAISPEHFKAFCIKKNPHTELTVSGHDTFYSHPTDPNSFFRYRESDNDAELTFKRKTQDNNVVRTEYNLNLAGNLCDKGEAFCKDMGYVYNVTIFKVAFVYVYEAHLLCYYVVYDSDLVELGRFIEIELCEQIAWESEQAARKALINVETGCKELGLTSLNRVSASLFEMYRKN